MSQFHDNSIFWIEVDKIRSNPYQPRRDFDQAQLQSLADSIRQYGVLQALVVTRKEVHGEDGMRVEYELVAGERRLRAATLAGVGQVPVLIRQGTEEEARSMKLELAIIENVQREDLNPVDRARAFQRLVDEFGFNHTQIAKKIGKSREYVGNSVRLLALPEDILEAIVSRRLSEGHTRPLMMLGDRPEEQSTLFKEIIYKKLTVRETESIARRIAQHKIRRRDKYSVDPETVELEEKLTESLGTRVSIEKRANGGKLSIDFFSADDLHKLVEVMSSYKAASRNEMLDRFIAAQGEVQGGAAPVGQASEDAAPDAPLQEAAPADQTAHSTPEAAQPSTPEEPRSFVRGAPAGEAGARGTDIHTNEAPVKPGEAANAGSPVEEHIARDPFVQAMQNENQNAPAEEPAGAVPPADSSDREPLAQADFAEPKEHPASEFATGDEQYENELLDDRSQEEKDKAESEDLYSVRNFTI